MFTGYSICNSDEDLVIFLKLSKEDYCREFVTGRVVSNKHKKNNCDIVYSSELIGLRGVISGSYNYLALYQYQIPESKFKNLVEELSTEYWDKIYNVLCNFCFKQNQLLGKHALHQLFNYSFCHFLIQNHKCPTNQFKMPECFSVINKPHYHELYNKFMSYRDIDLPLDLIDAIKNEKPQKIDMLHHDDAFFHKKIIDYVLELN